MAQLPEPTGLALADGLAGLSRPTVEDYCNAAAEYIRGASDSARRGPRLLKSGCRTPFRK